MVTQPLDTSNMVLGSLTNPVVTSHVSRAIVLRQTENRNKANTGRKWQCDSHWHQNKFQSQFLRYLQHALVAKSSITAQKPYGHVALQPVQPHFSVAIRVTSRKVTAC